MLDCKWCDELFISAHGNQIYCSVECRTAYSASNGAERMAACRIRKGKDVVNAYSRELQRAKRLSVIGQLGGVCVCCEIDKWQFLAVDHVAGGGTKLRLEMGVRQAFNALIVSNTAQLLCHNCNGSYGAYGYCPHCQESSFPVELPSIKKIGSKKLWMPYYKRYRNQQLRLNAFSSYGAQCSCCFEYRYEFLTIDHIEGGGSEHRKKVHNIYEWLRANGYPKGFRTLCYNCNGSLGLYGTCPHKENGYGR